MPTTARIRARRARWYGRAGGVAVLTAALLGTSCSKAQESSNVASTTTTEVATVNSVGGLKIGPPDGQPRKGGKLTYGIDAEPEGLDPTRYAFSQAGHAVASAVFDSLTVLDETGKAVPSFATDITANGDYTVWTVTIPDGVTFHDGEAADAAALKQGFDAFKASGITGAALKFLTDVKVTDPTHLELTLDRPIRSFPALLSTQLGYVISPKMLTDTDLAKKPIGTGPFVFEGHIDGERWSFKKNTSYHIPELPHLDTIEFRPVIDSALRSDMLRKGDLDVIQTIDGSQIKDLRTRSNIKIVENRYGDKAFLTLNTSAPPFDKLTARKAVARATDAASWRRELTADVATEINGPYGPGQPGFLKDNGYPTYDPEEAKKLVTQYKQETGEDLTFTFTAADDPLNARYAQNFAQAFKDAGMTVEVRQLPQIQLLAQVATGNYQLSQFRLFGQPNPDADAHFYRSTSVPDGPGISINFPRFESDVVDDAIDEAVASDDPKVRAAAYEKVSRTLAEQVPYVWLGQYTWMVASGINVNGIYGAVNGSVPPVGNKAWIAQLSLAA